VKPLLITAFASLLPDGGLPDKIAYLPEVNQAITPFGWQAEENRRAGASRNTGRRLADCHKPG
jgi:hypothetical protein